MKLPFHLSHLMCLSAFALLISTETGSAQQATPQMAESAALRGASVSAVVVDLVTGEVLDAYRPNDKLCPASVWKLVTASAALEVLGPDFTFRTTLVYRGNIEGRVLHGDILVVGGGDPSLGSRHFGESFDALLKSWAQDIRNLGVDSVTGSVIANAAHFQGDGIPRTRIWEDMANYYGAAPTGLNVHDNTYFVRFETADEPGVLAKLLGVLPEVPNLSLHSEVITSTVQRDMAFIFGAPGSDVRHVRGTLPMGRKSFEIKGSLPDPALFLAYHLHKQLGREGVSVNGGYKAEHHEVHEQPTLKQIKVHLSPPLNALLRHMLVESDNLFAEALLMQIGLRNGVPTLEGGLTALKKAHSTNGAQGDAFFAYDGSGLSRFNAISAMAVAEMLVHARGKEHLRKNLLDVLPLAGKEGTVKYFAKNSNLDGNARLKSGSMDRVRAYAGTFGAYTGRELGFAVLVNNFEGDNVEVRKAIEQWLLAAYGKY